MKTTLTKTKRIKDQGPLGKYLNHYIDMKGIYMF